MKSTLVAAILTVASATAHADQCQVLDAATAAKVRAIVDRISAAPIDGSHRYAALCEPCGGKVPDPPFTPRSVAVRDSLMLDGHAVDLAYTYVQLEPGRFENLAILAGCPVQGVSPSLRVEDETTDGELITASNAPVRIEPEPEAEALVAQLPAAVAAVVAPLPPAPITYTTTIYNTVPWLAIALTAGGAGLVLGGAAALLLVGARRRRPMEPRATRLTV